MFCIFGVIYTVSIKANKSKIVQSKIDILENDIVNEYPGILDILLFDRTTRKNIFWGTNNYQYLGNEYRFNQPICPYLITGERGHVIMPRVKKDLLLQQTRSKEMAEVFTPSWVCNAQNNLIDNAWFGRENVFNSEGITARTWKTTAEKIVFPPAKNWKDYVKDIRLEITCGEAPYITSRYDTTTGEFIPIKNRIGLLDRKLRVINENVHTSTPWLKATQDAYRSMYAYEWQGDNLLLAREAMLITFIENYKRKFGKEPTLRSIRFIAYIISWNVWQMDGIKGVVPNSCGKIKTRKLDLFGFESSVDNSFCKGCLDNNIRRHNGKYCLIKDWSKKDEETGKKGRKIRYIDLIKR